MDTTRAESEVGPVVPGLFVATDLDHFKVPDSSPFATDLQIDDRVFRLLDPAYYAWLRSRMEKAKRARDAGRLPRPEFDTLRARFNAVHDWAVAHLGEPALRAAVKAFVPGDFILPASQAPEDLVPFGSAESSGAPVPQSHSPGVHAA